MIVNSRTRLTGPAPMEERDGYLLQSEDSLVDAVAYAIERSAAVGAGEAPGFLPDSANWPTGADRQMSGGRSR